MARARKHSGIAGAALAVSVALALNGIAAAANVAMPSSSEGANLKATLGDPRTGPHARDEARHAGQALSLAPATATPPPLKLDATGGERNPKAAGAHPLANRALSPSNPKLAREVFGPATYMA